MNDGFSEFYEGERNIFEYAWILMNLLVGFLSREHFDKLSKCYTDWHREWFETEGYVNNVHVKTYANLTWRAFIISSRLSVSVRTGSAEQLLKARAVKAQNRRIISFAEFALTELQLANIFHENTLRVVNLKF